MLWLNVRRTVLFVLSMLLMQVSFAQDRAITGRVTDANGAPLAGASVVAKGSNKGVVTNDAGRFTISVAPAITTLVVSSTGFTAQEVSIGSTGEVSVALASSSANLGEVVVVAYGTRVSQT